MGRGISWGGSGSNAGFARVSTFADLPNYATNVSAVYVVDETTGEGETLKPAGLYIAKATYWRWLGESVYDALQIKFTPVTGFSSTNVDGVIAEIAGQLASLVAGLATESSNRGTAINNHGHSLAAITGLAEALADTARALHAHGVGDVTGLQDALDAKTAVGHTHGPSDVAGLTNALNSKTDVGHGHGIADTVGLTEALFSRAPIEHGHGLGDVAGLVNALNSKTDINHGHGIASITGLQDELAGKTSIGHGHGIGDIAGLATALGGFSPAVHGHAMADITGLVDELANIRNTPPSNHVHDTSQITGLVEALAGKSAVDHGHVIASITGLQDELNSKSPVSHGHGIGSIIGLQLALDDKASIIHGHTIGDVTGLQTALNNKAGAAHGHDLLAITGLQDALDAKAMVSHGHALSHITGLENALNGKALAIHSHALSDIVGLQGELDSKALSNHGHVISSITGLQDALDAKTNTGHGHVISDIANLQNALNAKSPIGHLHAIADVTNLQATLDAKAPISHNHAQADIVGLAATLAAKADLVGGKLVTSQLPSLAVTEFLGSAANQATMLALVGERGDWCFRTDFTPARMYILTADNPSLIANWQFVEVPGGAVQSVNAQVGIVVLGKADVGLSNVDNTSDASKPVSTATATALGTKEPTVAGGQASQYWNGLKQWITLDKAAVGLANVDNTSDASKPVSTATATALGTKEPTVTGGLASQYWNGLKQWATLDKAAVGLPNVDNTSDAGKPVSTATQTALNAKLNAALLSAFGLSLLDDTDAGVARSTLGLGTAATASASAFEAAGAIATAISSHIAAGDPHSQYLTQAEADALYKTLALFIEDVQDIVGTMIAAAGGSYNDAAGTITLPSGGGGIGYSQVKKRAFMPC